MRLFITNVNLNTLNIEKIKHYKSSSIKKYLLITNDNLLLIKKDKIYKLKQIDYKYNYTKFKEYDILIDKSYFKEDCIINYIAYNHNIIEFLIEEYKIQQLDEIQLILEYIKKEDRFILYNFYFKIDNNKLINPNDLNKFNLEILDTFLSLLTNVN